MDYNKVYKNKGFYWGLEPNDITVKALKFVSKGKVLDIGGGEGRDCFFLASKSFDVTLVDKSNEGVLKAKEHALELGLKLKTKVSLIESLKISGEFQIILCNHVLQFLNSSSVSILINKMKEHTSKNGLNVVSAFYEKNPNKNFSFLLKKNELKEMYSGWEILHYKEFLTPFESHGGGPQHRHGIVQIISRKR